MCFYFLVDGKTGNQSHCASGKIMDNVSDQNFQFNNEYKGRQDEIGILYADYEKMLNQLDMLIKENTKAR